MAMAMSLDVKVFQETQGAIVRGEYSTPEGPRKFLGTRLMQEDVDYFDADEVAELLDSADERFANALSQPCTVAVRELDTLEAALLVNAERADADDEGAMPVLALNFVNAFEAGGNVYIGKNTQESELCRRSTLFASISSFEARPFYDANRDNAHGVYTNGILVSPHVEVFRELGYLTMDAPVVVAAVSTPAPFANSLAHLSEDEMLQLMKTRLVGMLAVAADNGYKHLVLGAWGCGSNNNDPALVARAFHQALEEPVAGGTFAQLFSTVTFAIIDDAKGQPNLSAFRAEFE